VNWADWSVNTWCPILGPVPDVEGMTEGDPAGQAATLIHHLRRDFFDVDMVTTDSVQVANAPRNPDEYDHGHDWIAQARVIHREAAAIEQHAVGALDIWRKTRSGGQEPLRLADAFKECSDGRQGASVDTLERLLTTAVNRALEFQVGFAAARGAPPPFKIEAWPIHNVLALLAIHAAADCIHDFLADYRDQTEVRRYRALGNAQTLDRLARERLLLPMAKKAARQDEQRQEASTKSRTPKPLADARAKALAWPGEAKAQWQFLIETLKTDGFSVREYMTEKGDAAFEVQLPNGPRTLAFKTFANQKSR